MKAADKYKLLYIVFSYLSSLMAFGIIVVFLFGDVIDAPKEGTALLLLQYLSGITMDKRIIFSIVFFAVHSILVSGIITNKVARIVLVSIIYSTFTVLGLLAAVALMKDFGTIVVSSIMLICFSILDLLFMAFTLYFSQLSQNKEFTDSIDAVKAKRVSNVKSKPVVKKPVKDKTDLTAAVSTKEVKEENNAVSKEESKQIHEEQGQELIVEQELEKETEPVKEEPVSKDKVISELQTELEPEVASKEEQKQNFEQVEKESTIEPTEESQLLQNSNVVEKETVNVLKEQAEETKHVEEMTIENKPIEPIQQTIPVQPQPKPHKKISVDEYIRLFQSDLIMADLNNKYIIPKKKKNDGGIRWDSFEQGMIVSLDEQIKDIPAKTEGVVLGINRDYTVDIGFIIRGKKVILAVAARQLSIKEN